MMTRTVRRLLAGFLFFLVVPTAAAQQRPLTTEEAETVQPGEVLLQFGYEYIQDARFPLAGLEGDLSRIGVVDVRFGLAQAAELQIQGTIRNYLSVSDRRTAFIAPRLSRDGLSTSDVGDVTLAAKFRLWRETEDRPALGFRVGFEIPNSDEARGIGLNTTNVFATVLVQKHFGRLNVFGNLGVGILQACAAENSSPCATGRLPRFGRTPAGPFTQNDVFLYGIGATYPVHERINLVGEIAGRQSFRDTPETSALVGTGSRSQARLGVQVFAGGFRWDVAGLAGLTKNDGDTGFAFGVSKSVQLWPASTVGR